MRRFAGLIVTAAFLAGCAGTHSGGVLPFSSVSPEQSKQALAHLHVSIKIPKRRHRRGHGDRYVSASTQSIQFKVYNAKRTTLLQTVSKNLTPTSAGCTTVSSGTTCTFAIGLSPGQISLDVTTFDGTNATGHALSAMVAQPFTLKAGKANHLALTLGGLVASFRITTVNAVQSTYSASTGLSIIGGQPQSITILPLDADGNTIVGSNAPTPVIAATPADTTLVAPTAGSHTYTLTSTFHTATNPTIPHAGTISVSASPVPGSGATTFVKSIPLKLYQPWIYVVDGSNNTLKAYDEAGNAKTLSGSFSGLSAAYYVVYSPTTNLLYVSDWYDILPFDVMGNTASTSGSFSTSTGVGQPLLDTNNNLLYFPNYSNSVVSVYDLQGHTQTLSGTPFSGVSDPWVSVYDTHNGLLYVPNYGANTMGVYNEQGVAQTSGSFSNLNDTYGLAFDSNNNFIYAANSSTTAPVTVYDESGNQQTPSGGFSSLGANEASGIGFDPYNNKIYVSSGTVQEFDEQGNAQTLGAGAFSGLGASIYGVIAVP